MLADHSLLTVLPPAFRLRVVVSRLLTGRCLPASLLKGTAGGTAGSAMAFIWNNYLSDFTSHVLPQVQKRF